MSPEIEAEFRRLQELVLEGDEVIRHGQSVIRDLTAERDLLRREVARLGTQLEIITAENHTRATLAARSLEDWANLRAEVEMLRGEGCREKKLDEPESGPCGICIRCAEDRGAYWAITELPHAGRPGMLPEDRALAAAEAGRARARMVK